MTSKHYEPIGTRFIDLASNRQMVLVSDDEPREALRGWVCYRHPDGQWVTLRKATMEDRTAVTVAQMPVIRSGGYREIALGVRWSNGEDGYWQETAAYNTAPAKDAEIARLRAAEADIVNGCHIPTLKEVAKRLLLDAAFVHPQGGNEQGLGRALRMVEGMIERRTPNQEPSND